MFKFFGIIIVCIVGLGLLFLAISFISNNIWLFVGILIVMIILVVLFLVIKSKMKSRKRQKIRMDNFRRMANDTLDYQDVLKETTEERRQKNTK